MSNTQTGSPRSVADLIASTQSGKVPEFFFFREHRSASRGPTGPACLSQWWPSPFSIDDTDFPTAIHFMMACKARMFGDENAVDRILSTAAPKVAFTVGRQVKGFDREVWESKREQIVMEGNVAKFSQDPELSDYLLETGDNVLIFANPTDKIWGTGVDALDLRSRYPERWRGLNLLGFLLMELRSQLSK